LRSPFDFTYCKAASSIALNAKAGITTICLRYSQTNLFNAQRKRLIKSLYVTDYRVSISLANQDHLNMNVNKKLDRFKQWAGERMGGEVKTNVSDDFKALEVEMGLRHEG
jgi:hypothetical protein